MDASPLKQLAAELEADLGRRAAAGLARELSQLRRLPGGRILVGDRELWDFSSNDYLGLSQHPAVREAAARAARDYGAGAGASRLVSGNHPLYRQVEERLAALKHADAALVFSSGYACNLGLFSSLAGKGDVILCDRLNHASLFDAARLSGANLRVFPHRDLERLESLLARYSGRPPRRMFVATDGVFSMDGDLAPLPEMLELCERFGAVLIVDDAHGFGVMGQHGGGCVEHWGVDPGRLIAMGTLSKAVGSVGGYVVGPRVLCETLVNRARSFVYSTGLPPAALGAASAALELLPDMTAEREHLRRLARLLDAGATTPIVPKILGSSERAEEAAQTLRQAGFFTVAIRPPTVPAETARLRISLSAPHPMDVVQALAERLRTV